MCFMLDGSPGNFVHGLLVQTLMSVETSENRDPPMHREYLMLLNRSRPQDPPCPNVKIVLPTLMLRTECSVDTQAAQVYTPARRMVDAHIAL